MDLIQMARASGLTVILDGRIGREEYQSVCGPISALERFADALHQGVAHRHDGAPRRSSAGSVFGRLRRRISRLASITGAMAKPARNMSRVVHRSRK
ncbi:hypothetical protein [Paraburkholderia oxyphila]|uniref:hypothetical protein n=1 Tax=Paraburkholderia oxyphila TaxID=614212 RepID=UPI0012ED2D7F|nr:hypothetical protein [Paraburkholderia oxyphila]